MGEKKRIEKSPNCKNYTFRKARVFFRKARVVFDLQAKFGIVFGSFCFNGDQESTLDLVFLQVVQRRMGYGKYGQYDII